MEASSSDGFILSDASIYYIGMSFSSSDIISFIDTVNVSNELLVNLNESILLSDNTSVSFSLIGFGEDAFALEDQSSGVGAFTSTASDSMFLLDFSISSGIWSQIPDQGQSWSQISTGVVNPWLPVSAAGSSPWSQVSTGSANTWSEISTTSVTWTPIGNA
jgi:hypothetical protein